MLENFIYAKQKSLFEEKLNNGEVLDEAIVFIEDTREIWNHGTYFDGNAVDLSDVEKSIRDILDNIPTKVSDLENDSGYLTEHQDISHLATKAELPTKVSQLENDEGYLTSHQDISYLATKDELQGKVDKVDGKQLSTEDFTTALKNKLSGLNNYDDTTITQAIQSLQTQFNTLVSGNASTAIESFNEIIAFLDNVQDTEDLASIIASIEQQLVWEKAEGEAGIRLKGTNGTATGASSISAGDDKIASDGTEYKSVASGDHAVAFGYGNTCSGRTTLAQGLYNIVNGKDSVAFGQRNLVDGDQAFAAGQQNEVATSLGIALGYQNKTTNIDSIAMGYKNTSGGSGSIALGDTCESLGTSSTAMGYKTKATGSYSSTFGKSTQATNDGEVSMGSYNKSTTSTNTAEQTSFSFGIGTSDTNRINAFEIKKNGDVYIGDKLLSNVATSGSYNDLTDKPTIPTAVTESTVSGWGFTKNTGTITGVSANGTSVATSGVANIPAASTSAYGVTKLSSSISSTSTTLAATASSVKAAYDLANGKQEKLVSGTNIKTINGESILGEGNIVINSSSSEETTIDNGVYAVTADEKLIDYNEADESCIGVALIAGEHKFMIAKSDATDGTNTTLYWGKNLFQKDVAGITNTSGSGYIGEGKTYGTDFTTWSTGPVVDFNGAANTAAIIAGYTEHGVSMDARDMCTVLNTFNTSDSYNDWYVPACGQLALMYLAKTDINAALANIGGTAFESNSYWSSSENDASYAWRVNFNYGYVNLSNKGYDAFRVRFIRDITVKSLKERVSDLESKIKDLNTSGSSNGAYAEINHGTSDTTFTLTPNTFHVWDEVASLDLSFAEETAGVANEYLFQFTSGATATTLTLPDGLKWAEELVVASNAVYQVSVLKGLGVWVEF